MLPDLPRRLVFVLTFALFGVAHVTLDRVPSAALKALKGGQVTLIESRPAIEAA
jgi:hypothetical protein